jgi:hypothetical protein
MVKRRDERAKANMDESTSVYNHSRVLMLALVLGGLAVSVLLGGSWHASFRASSVASRAMPPPSRRASRRATSRTP